MAQAQRESVAVDGSYGAAENHLPAQVGLLLGLVWVEYDDVAAAEVRGVAALVASEQQSQTVDKFVFLCPTPCHLQSAIDVSGLQFLVFGSEPCRGEA